MNDTRVAGIVLANLEYHLHQVATNVGNLGEDTAGNTQGRSAEALTDGEAHKAAAGQVFGHTQQDDEHQHKLDADQHDADAHTGTQRNVEQVERTAAQRGKSHTGIGQRVHTHAEPGHAVAAKDTDDGPRQHEAHTANLHIAEHTEIECYGSADEEEKNDEKLALLLQVGRAGLENHVADFEHRFVGLQVAHFAELPETKQQSQCNDEESPVKDFSVGIRAESFRHHKVCLACKAQCRQGESSQCR